MAFVTVENVVLNLIMIPKYGADGTAFNAALSGVLLAVLSIALVSRHSAASSCCGRSAHRSPVGWRWRRVLPPTFRWYPRPRSGPGLPASALVFERLAFPEDLAFVRAAVWR